MCHGHPRNHPCSHASVHWHYCPSAVIDLATGYESPCQNQSFAKSQQSNADCPLAHCSWGNLGGSWICCACGRGPNTLGWCTTPVVRERTDPATLERVPRTETCDHGCCERCLSTDDSISLPDTVIPELKKPSSKASARAARSRPAYSKAGYDYYYDYDNMLDSAEAAATALPVRSKIKSGGGGGSLGGQGQGRARARTSSRRDRR
jgi:hypothetical protein